MIFSRVVVIAEPNDAFRKFLVRKHSAELCASSGGTFLKIDRAQDATATNLFGDVYVYHVPCGSKEDFMVACKTLEGRATEPWGGLILSTGAPLNTLKKPLATLSGLGCAVVKGTGKNRVRKELETAGFSKQVSSVIAAHAGEELPHIIGALDYACTLTPQEVQNLTVEDVWKYLPVEPGTQAPWGILDAVISGNAADVISIIDRAGGGETFPAAVLKSKIEDVLPVAALIAQNPKMTLDDAVSLTGLSMWSARGAFNLARRYGFDRVLYVATRFSEYLRNPYRTYTADELKMFCLSLCA